MERQASFTANPLWESFEGFKLHKGNQQDGTPEIRKQRSVAQSPQETPQLLAGMPCSPQTPEFQSPAEFSSPAFRSPFSVVSREGILENDTPEHLALESLSPTTTRQSSSSHTPALLNEAQRKDSKSHKKKNNIFARFLQASGNQKKNSA